MKLLDKQFTERIDLDEGEGAVRMHFMFLRANKKSQNGNIYSAPILKEAAQNFTERAKQSGMAFGGLGHDKQLEIDHVSHGIESVQWNEDKQGLEATIRVFPNSPGRTIKQIITAGGRVGISARGVGEKDANGNVTKYDLQGLDFTLNPSFSENFVGEEHIFESLGLDPVQTDLCEQRWQNAVRMAGYSGTLEQYKQVFSNLIESTEKNQVGDLHQASIDRSKALPKAADGFPATYSPGNPGTDGEEDDAGPTEEELDLLSEALENALSEKYPGFKMDSFNGEEALVFSDRESQWYLVKYTVDENGIAFGDRKPIEA